MSESAKPTSSEAKELSLIGKVELKIALAGTDAELKTTLKTFLAPLLLKLASEHLNVRNKVISVCQHINTRIKSPSVKLPVAALLQQFRQYPSTPLIRHFDLLYIQQGIRRLSITKQLKLLPIIVNGISSDASISASHGAVLFNLLLSILPNLSLPERGSLEDRGLRDQLGLARSEDITFLALWFGKLLLYTPNGSEHVESTQKACPGLSADEYDFLTLHDKKDTWSAGDSAGLNLTETKITIARFLASGVFTDQERFLPALFSSADSNSRISNVGVDLLRRASSNVSLEDPTLIQQLFHIYFGNTSSGGPLPAGPALKIQILTLLSKSVIATTFTANVIQLLQEGLTTSEAPDASRDFLKSVSGREASKMRKSAFSFIIWTGRMGSFADLQVIAPPLVHRLREYVEGQGWPNPNDDARSAQYLSLRGMAYQSIGILAMHSPRELLLEPNLDLLHWLFKALSEDGSGSDIAVSVEEAIGSVLNCFKTGLDWDVEEGLRSLLLHHMTLDDGAMSDHSNGPTQVRRSTRFVAVRFANRCLRYSDVVARWIDLLAIGGRPGERHEVIEEGQKGLSPYWYQILNPLGEGASRGRGSAAAKPTVQFPDFSETIEFITPRITSSSRVEQQELLPNLSLNEQTLEIVAPAVTFCRAILISQALVSVEGDIKFDVDWDRKLDSAVSSDELARAAIKAYLNPSSTVGNDERTRAISTFLLVLYNGMVWNHGEGLPKCGEYFVDVCALCSNAMLSQLAPHVISWTSSIWSNKHDTRTTAAHAFGILASHPAFPSEELQKLLVTLLNKARTWKSAVGAGINQVHGSILALGFLWGRLKLRAHPDSLPETDLHVLVVLIFDILAESGERTLQEAIVTAIDQLCLFSVLGPAQIPPNYTPNMLVDKMIEKARSGNDKAILALGHFAMSLKESKSEDSLHNQILNRLYALHDVRQPEVQFAVGEALTCAATGWDSKSLIAVLDVEESPPDLVKPGAVLSDVLIQVLSHCKSTKPAMRKASAIWLLCIVQFNGHAPCVQRSLRQCQAAFKRFLADRDSLVQETASRGLALVYEKGGKQLKDDLVRDLMASFTSTNANLGGSVAEDTELFEPGALPTAEGSVTTYKDIMSLASEVGDPSLVYRFMSLASHDAIWSSRAAFGRFGLDTLLSDSSVDGYLAQNPKLYPKLFRYRFDPNPNVQRAMNDIWVATVKDPASILEEHFDEILDDLLRNILGKEWRVRQACCAAIADLVQGSHFEKYEKHLNKIWAKSFKVVDDIKLSVRTAAMALVSVLAGILTRNLEAGESAGEKASSMLQQVVPFLLSSSGLEASAREIQQYALTTLLSIIKKSSGKHLKPFIPVLVEVMLALLSSLEPEAVNYIHLNASKYDLTEEKIDEMRLISVRGSPMMEAIERCLDHLDEPTMAALSPALEGALKGALGLPSKVGCSRVLVSLSTRRSFLFRRHGGHFLKIVQKLVLDRNETVSNSYCTACGYLARLASDTEVLGTVDFAKHIYFESEDSRHRIVSGDMIHAISKHSNDRFAALAKDILPFAFIAKHDSIIHVKQLFASSWDENVGGSRAVLLYLEEIVALAKHSLNAAQWEIKQTTSRAVADAVLTCGNELNQTSAALLWPVLNDALGGKTWEGKERVLDAFIVFIQKAPHFWKDNASVARDMEKLIIRESKRRNVAYRRYALRDLGLFAEIRDDVDMYSDILDIVAPIIEDLLKDETEMDIDSEFRDHLSGTARDATLANAISALFLTINFNNISRRDLTMRLTTILQIVSKASLTGSRVIQAAIIESEKILLEKLYKQDAIVDDLSSGQLDRLLLDLLLTFYKGRMDGTEQIRELRADVTLSLGKVLSQGASPLIAFLKDTVTKARADERSSKIQLTLDSALECLEQ